jgi:outer membrane protein assembly factor BamB
LTRTGHLFSIPAATLESGGTLDKPVGHIDAERELSDAAPPVSLPDGSTVFTPEGNPNRLFVRGPALTSSVRAFELLAPLGAQIAALGDGVLAPTTDGRIYLMSPSTGKPIAEPFHPALVAGEIAKWRGVAVTSKGTIVAVDETGNLYQVDLKKDSIPELVERGNTKFTKPIRSGIAASGDLVACVDESNVMHIWNGEALSPVSEIALPSPASIGPLTVGNYMLVAAGDDELVCVDAQGQELWRHPLNGQRVAGKPIAKGETLHFVTSNGLVHALRLADGSEIWTLDTEKPLSGGPIEFGDKLVVVGDDGTLNVVQAP